MTFAPRFRGLRVAKLVKTWRAFSRYVAKSRGLVAGALLCGLGATLMQLLRPWPIKIVFDVVLVPAGPEAGGWLVQRLDGLPTGVLLAGVCAGLLVISLAWGLCSFGQTYLTARAGQAVVYALRARVYGHLQRLSLRFHQRQRRGDLLMRMTGDVNLLRDMLVDALVMGVAAVMMLAVMLSILTLMDWRLTLVVAALLPLLTLTTFRFSFRIRSAAQRQRKNEGRIAAAINEMLQGIQTIQAYGRARLQERRFQRGNRRNFKAGLRTTRLEASMSRVIEVLLAAGTAAVFWYGVRRVQAGVLTPGDLLVFVSYVHGSFRPIRRLARVSSRVAKALVCSDRLRELLRAAPEVVDAPGARRAKRIAGRIELQRVGLAYPGKEKAVHRVSFTVEPGSFVAVVGPSGAGKSTLLALLLRLYDPDRGRIRLDGRDLRRYRVESLRDQIAVVLQEPFLFGASVTENIAFGRPGASEIEIVRAAKEADALEFIRELPEGFETQLAEAGRSLSAGQRQRIAIARAFLRQAPILLLDEPTQGLDGVAERKVLSATRRLMKGRTTLMVAHRLSMVTSAERILVMRRGRVAEEGDHATLVAAGGWYARTWRSQNRKPSRPAPGALPAASGAR